MMKAYELVRLIEDLKPDQAKDALLRLCENDFGKTQVEHVLHVSVSEIDSDSRDLQQQLAIARGTGRAEDNALVVNERRKRKREEDRRPRYAVCERCELGFDVSDNKDGDCLYREGNPTLNLESELWEDHAAKMRVDGSMITARREHSRMWRKLETPQYYKEYPEAFKWTCCKARLCHPRIKGCAEGRHVPNASWSKKPRWE